MADIEFSFPELMMIRSLVYEKKNVLETEKGKILQQLGELEDFVENEQGQFAPNPEYRKLSKQLKDLESELDIMNGIIRALGFKVGYSDSGVYDLWRDESKGVESWSRDL